MRNIGAGYFIICSRFEMVFPSRTKIKLVVESKLKVVEHRDLALVHINNQHRPHHPLSVYSIRYGNP